jgi:hypothetical protein
MTFFKLQKDYTVLAIEGSRTDIENDNAELLYTLPCITLHIDHADIRITIGFSSVLGEFDVAILKDGTHTHCAFADNFSDILVEYIKALQGLCNEHLELFDIIDEEIGNIEKKYPFIIAEVIGK